MLKPATAALVERMHEANAADHPFVNEPGLTLAQHEATAKALHDLADALAVLGTDRRSAARFCGMLDAIASAATYAAVQDAIAGAGDN
ncbi:hypothetical protein [Micromonospora sp. WMMD980]|uniref:hypothetical protein n=1 Tax=Micromonospora sp. WMMD980 TaxID=3016088 RepID=UPI00241705DB|nr:hypothetical protein [Micromonospora sp. WMMD980]MDG4801700.1 hypothetical protein [Micromonospora sp. WMMD980]